MASRVAKVLGAAAVALGVVGGGVALWADGDDSLNPAAEAVNDLPTITDFSLKAQGGCVFDADRGGMVYQGLQVASRSNGRFELSFYVQRGSLDDVLPGYVSTVLAFDDDTPSHTFDLVIPVTQEQYDAGYDECRYSTTGE